jgi:hypothetical protein
MNRKEDWRLQNQESYLAGLEWEKRDYFQYSDDWDHDHCEFCGVKMSVGAKLEESIGHGYTAKKGYYWVCEQCFSDFRKQFEWKILGE